MLNLANLFRTKVVISHLSYQFQSHNSEQRVSPLVQQGIVDLVMAVRQTGHSSRENFGLHVHV